MNVVHIIHTNLMKLHKAHPVEFNFSNRNQFWDSENIVKLEVKWSRKSISTHLKNQRRHWDTNVQSDFWLCWDTSSLRTWRCWFGKTLLSCIETLVTMERHFCACHRDGKALKTWIGCSVAGVPMRSPHQLGNLEHQDSWSPWTSTF